MGRFMTQAALLSFLLVLSPHALDLATRKYFPAPAAGAGILITGASSGIGRHAAVQLTVQGFRVFAGVRKASDAASLREEAPGIHPVILDVTSEQQISAAVEEVERSLGDTPLFGLVNNAGISKSLPLEVQPMAQVRSIFDINVLGTFAVSKAFMPMLRRSAGRIVNVGSLSGLVATPGKGAYSGAKFALEGMSDSWRTELAHWGMSVSLVDPGYVSTEISRKQIGSNAPKNMLTAAQRELYAYLLADADEKRIAAEAKADPPTCTTEAIVHALTSEYPRTRYLVANALGIPSWLVGSVLPLLPDRIRDLVLAPP